MYGIAITGCPGVLGNAVRSECYFTRKPIMRFGIHKITGK
jgi:hypothetical protein